MNNYYTSKGVSIFFCILFMLASVVHARAQSHDVDIVIHLRGVYASKIILLNLSVDKTFKPVEEVQNIKNGETTKLTVSRDYLPGEFVLRFEYKEKESSAPYPSERNLFINDQEPELWINPMYCNNADSSYFQKDERENGAFVKFSKENGRQKEKLGLLQNLLMNYDDPGSKFYRQGIREYEQRRQAYDQWLDTRISQDKPLFVSRLYCLQFVPKILWKGSENDRVKSMIAHYFDGMDFKDPVLIKTSGLSKWMDTYVNLYGQLCTTAALRDSLFPVAGKTAIEKARQGNPLVYGWMVDYFYRGYETNGITAGMKILEPYLSDSTCLTSKRQEIARRLKGMETLVSGSTAPNIIMKDSDENLFDLNLFKTECRYILILFWSAGCSHCVETVDLLYPWQQQTGIQQKVQVLAVSLDETETEIRLYKQKIMQLKGWKHLHAKEGVRSKAAADYFVLATPVMVLVDAKTMKIVDIPGTVRELMAIVN